MASGKVLKMFTGWPPESGEADFACRAAPAVRAAAPAAASTLPGCAPASALFPAAKPPPVQHHVQQEITNIRRLSRGAHTHIIGPCNTDIAAHGRAPRERPTLKGAQSGYLVLQLRGCAGGGVRQKFHQPLARRCNGPHIPGSAVRQRQRTRRRHKSCLRCCRCRGSHLRLGSCVWWRGRVWRRRLHGVRPHHCADCTICRVAMPSAKLAAVLLPRCAALSAACCCSAALPATTAAEPFHRLMPESCCRATVCAAAVAAASAASVGPP